MVAIDPETGNWRPIYTGLELAPGPVSPDGRYFVYSRWGVELPDDEVGIWVYDMTGKTPARRIFERKGQPSWTNEGRHVVIGSPVGNN
jgi:Tol biopolymer transport system component